MSQYAILTYTYTSSAKCEIFRKKWSAFTLISNFFAHLRSLNGLVTPKIEFLAQFWVINVSLKSLLPLRNYVGSMLKDYIQKWNFLCL